VNQKSGDTAILVADDRGSSSMASSIRGNLLWVGSSLDGDGITIDNGWITVRAGKSSERLFDTEKLRIPGSHNIVNAMTVAVCAHVLGIASPAIAEGLAAFTGIPHRLEFICERDGVKYFNDSKATTPEAAAAAVNAFDGTVVPIFGGYDKNVSFDGMAEAVSERIEWAALIGATAPKISSALEKAGVRSTIYISLEDAVAACTERAGSDGVVLLTPGCASYDMFSDYEQRGDMFRSLAERLCGEEG
jgi:UDP-N-acetylmuramoylalanine--D-glutamate ligase